MFLKSQPNVFKNIFVSLKKTRFTLFNSHVKTWEATAVFVFKLNVVKFQIPSSLSNMGSEQLGLCPLPELALHLHPNYAQPKVSP